MPSTEKNSKLDVSCVKKAVQSAYQYNTCHILYNSKDKAWVVKSVRQAVGQKTFKTKSAAIGYAEKIKKRHDCAIVIYNKAGNIQRSVRHGIK